MSNNQHENRLGKLYQTVLDLQEKSTSDILPTGMTVHDIKKYIEGMVEDAQPRLIRTEGRPSFDLDDYRIPCNYFVVESNSIPFHSSVGSIFVKPPKPEEIAETLDDSPLVYISTDDEEEEEEDQHVFIAPTTVDTNLQVPVPKQITRPLTNDNDYGQIICNYIFNNGRKTTDELLLEIKGIEKHLITLLILKLIDDDYLQRYKDVEKDVETGLEKELVTLELVPRNKKPKLDK